MVKGNKVTVSNKIKTRDVILLSVLIVVLLFVVMVRDKGIIDDTLTGKFLQQGANKGPVFQKEEWNIYECTKVSAESAVDELMLNYGCNSDYCEQAAYGVEMPYEITVDLRCGTDLQRTQWINWCTSYYKAKC